MRWIRIGSLAIGAGVLAWLIVELGPAAIWADLRKVGWGLAFGCLLNLAAIVLDSVTLRAMVAGARPRLLLVVRASISGHAINEATPGGKLGEITKFTVLGEALPKDRAAAALVAQNLVMFVVNCALLALAPALGVVAVGGPTRVAAILAAAGAGFLVAGGGVLWLLTRGVGRWPFRLLARVGVARARVDRWETRFDEVEKEWTAAARDRSSMAAAWGSAIASRLCNVAESAIYVSLAGGEHAIASGFLSLAASQALAWILFFVPFQAGSGESGALALFRAAGLSGQPAVVGELTRKLRRVSFIALGVVLLGVNGLRKDDPAARAPTS
jgi:hypothetical protein